MKNESFAEFCNRMATDTKTRIKDGDYTLPEKYKAIAPLIVKELKPRRNTFEDYAVTFIQSAFDNMMDVVETLEEKTRDGEIPDALLVYYAYNMFNDFDENNSPTSEHVIVYDELPMNLQNIIKVMSVYTILQS